MKYLILFICCTNVLVAQNYHYAIGNNEETQAQIQDLIYPVTNQIDWTVAGMEGGIPNYEHIIDVTSIGAVNSGETDNYDIVQNAINGVEQGTVLYFPKGVYLFQNTLVLKDSVVLRGEGNGATILKFNLNGVAQPSLWFKSYQYSETTPILSGYEQGSVTITVEDPTLFKVGQHAEILQDNSPELMYTNPDWDVEYAQNSVGQMAKIVSVIGNKITLLRPLLYNFSPSLNVRVKNAKMIVGAGVENLKLTRIDDGNEFNIKFIYAYNCWIRNIESEYADRGHVDIAKSGNLEIRDSYFHHAHNYGEGGHGYGVGLGTHTTSCLIENNIFHFLRHSFLAKGGAIGNVFAYNYSVEPNGSPNDIAMHGHYGLMNLLEGNIVQRIIAGDYWGPSGPGNTYFRNRISTSSIVIQDHSHFQNIIGNEIPNGTVSISSDTKNSWSHSNYSATGLIDEMVDFAIPSSLYLDEKPSFFGVLKWPAIGPGQEFGAYTIPAKSRWDSATDLVPYLEF